LLAGGCQKPAPAPLRELRVAAPLPAATFDPHASIEVSAFIVNANIYDTLVATDANLRPTPALAQSWSTPDDRTWIFDLASGVHFQDGSTLTSADVAFSLTRAQRDPDSAWAPALLEVEAVETPTPSQVIVRTRHPDAMLMQALSQTLVVPRSSGPIAEGRLASRPVGSGPFRFGGLNAVTGTVELVPWAGYWGKAPGLGRVSFSWIPDDERRISALLEGRVDLVSDVPSELARRIQSSGRYRMLEVPGLADFHLGFDTQRPRTPYVSAARNPFLDVRVRRAFRASIDTERLVREVLGGAGEPANQLVAPHVFGFDPSLPRSPLDAASARRLMSEAGYSKGFEVVLDAPEESFYADKGVAPFVADALGAIGIRVKLRRIPAKELFEREARHDTSLFLDSWNCSSGDLQEVLDFELHTADSSRGYGSQNVGSYSNLELDRLAERAHQTMLREERLEILRAATRLAYDDVPWVPLYMIQNRYGAAKDLNWEPRPDRLIRAASISFSRLAN
jgi:peptide/nickel transport system substrate-binding protein